MRRQAWFLAALLIVVSAWAAWAVDVVQQAPVTFDGNYFARSGGKITVSGVTSANLRAALTDESGTGVAYFQGGDLGTPSAGVLTSATGLPISTGVSGLGTGVATFLGTPSSANLASALTDETGTGAAVFGTAPTISDPILPPFTVSTSALTKTNNITATAVPGLSISLTAGKTYSCSGHLVVSAGAAGGLLVSVSTSNTLTATTSNFSGINYNGTTINANTSSTAFPAVIAATTAASTDLYITGAIVVNAAGAIIIKAAQNVSDATSTIIGLNSQFSCVRVN